MNWRDALILVRDREYPLENDWELLEAATLLADKVEKVGGRVTRQLTCDGVSKSISEWSRTSGIALSTIFDRLNSGWTEEEAVKTPTRSGSFGDKTLQQWSDETGISKSTIYARIKRGWSLERATGQDIDE